MKDRVDRTGRDAPPRSLRGGLALVCALIFLLAPGRSAADYVNFEASHVHPIALTPSGARLLAVNTPDATLEVFAVASDGSLKPQATIPVGLEPVTVKARTDTEAWVVNHLSDSVSIVDLGQGGEIEIVPHYRNQSRAQILVERLNQGADV